MTEFTLPQPAGSLVDEVRALLREMLTRKTVHMIMTQARTPYSALPMPMLITDPAKTAAADPLAPVAPFNAARQASALTRHATGRSIALVLRPCEIRAYRELIKLHQCVADDTLLIGIDCRGRMENAVYLEQAAQQENLTHLFYQDSAFREAITDACKMCENFQPEGADLFIGVAEGKADRLRISTETETGRKICKDLGLTAADSTPGQAEAITALKKSREAFRNARMADTAEKIKDIEGFQRLIAPCLNCYNCRTACPVCYCKECVFLTDVFAHPPETLIQRAEKRGTIKLPTDTTMFHLTRLAHMAHACVGCGQCSSVCPSRIPVADIFRTVAADVQHHFNYAPGRSLMEKIPFLAYGDKVEKPSA